MARVLEGLAIPVRLKERRETVEMGRVTTGRSGGPVEPYPFLAVRVRQIVHGLRVPLLSNAEEFHRAESVFSHDHEVDEESRSGLDHSDLSVRHGYQSTENDG